MRNKSTLLKRQMLALVLALLILPILAAPAGALTGEQPVFAPPPPSWPAGPHASVRVRELNVRSGPSTSYPILTVAGYREILSLTGRNSANAWLRVMRANGEQGWVSTPLVNVSNAHLSAVPIVDADPPGPPPSDGARGQVLARRLNVRSGPGTAHPAMAIVSGGEWVSLIGRSTDSVWLQIEWGGVQAWVATAYVRSTVPVSSLPVTGGSVPNPSPLVTGTITTERLNLRSGPGLGYGIKGWLYSGQQVTVLGRDGTGSWLNVRAASGLQGWVSGAYVRVGAALAGATGIEVG